MWNCGEQNSMTNSDFTPAKESRMAFTISFGVLPMPSSCRAQRMQRCPALGSGASPGACLYASDMAFSPRTRPISIVAGPSALGLTCGRIIGAIGFDPKSNFGALELLVNIQPEQTG